MVVAEEEEEEAAVVAAVEPWQQAEGMEALSWMVEKSVSDG